MRAEGTVHWMASRCYIKSKQIWSPNFGRISRVSCRTIGPTALENVIKVYNYRLFSNVPALRARTSTGWWSPTIATELFRRGIGRLQTVRRTDSGCRQVRVRPMASGCGLPLTHRLSVWLRRRAPNTLSWSSPQALTRATPRHCHALFTGRASQTPRTLLA